MYYCYLCKGKSFILIDNYSYCSSVAPWSIDTIVIIVVPCHDKDNFVSSTGTLVFMDLVFFSYCLLYTT